MPKPQPSFTAEFKPEAVQLTKTSDKPKAQIARESSISESALYSWCRAAVKLVQENAMVSSMSRTANCYDNAITESLFHILE